MSKMTTEQRRRIFGMATQLGLYEKDNKDDDLHALVYNLTGKKSISKLTPQDADKIISRLIQLKDGQKLPRKTKPTNDIHRPGMITPEQVKKVWYFMYRLAELDEEPSKAGLAKRLCGIIEKNLRVTAFEKEPLRFVNFEQGSILIEVIKRIVQNEKRKKKAKSV